MAKRTCSTKGCSKPHLARGYCSAHYNQARLTGVFVPETGFRHAVSEIDRDLGVGNCSICGDGVPVHVSGSGKSTCMTKWREHLDRKAADKKTRQLSPEAMDRKRAYHRNYAMKRRLERLGGLEGRAKLIASADSRCEICSVELADNEVCIDHDHSCCPPGSYCTFCVRGVLCNGCNAGIGYLRDDPVRLELAIKYLNDRSIATRIVPRAV